MVYIYLYCRLPMFENVFVFTEKKLGFVSSKAGQKNIFRWNLKKKNCGDLVTFGEKQVGGASACRSIGQGIYYSIFIFYI